MKRFTAAAVAAATAFSLSAGAASAQDLGFGSSAADSEIRGDVAEWQVENPTSDTIFQDPTSSIEKANDANEYVRENSSEETHNNLVESSWGIGKSSIKNDIENSDAPGTTLDTIFGIGAVLALGVGIYNLALQAGVQLPQLGR